MKKRKVILLAILMALAFALYASKSFFVNKIYNDILLKKEIHYLEVVENVREEAIEEASDDEDSTVYITIYGEKYHREYCRYLRRTKEEMGLEKAIKSGYEPCAVCKP